jgi:pentatricopeptide repeat protein
MTSAGKLVQIENNRHYKRPSSSDDSVDAIHDGNAIQVYTELINNLLRAPLPAGEAESKPASDQVDQTFSRQSKAQHANTLLLKVFLVFQEMKVVGAQPDLACYNALLHACAEARDLDRCHTVLDMIQAAGLHPNDNSWREIIRACGSRSDLATAMWERGLEYRGKDEESDSVRWLPSIKSFDALLTAYLRHASTSDDLSSQRELYKQVVDMYRSLLSGESSGMIVEGVGITQVHRSAKTMLLFLQAIVSLEQIEFTTLVPSDGTCSILRQMASRILDLECLQDEQITVPLLRNDNRSRKAVQVATTWIRK